MRILRPGDVAGLEAIVTSHYEYDAIAIDAVLVCRISAEVVKRLDCESPHLHQNYWKDGTKPLWRLTSGWLS